MGDRGEKSQRKVTPALYNFKQQGTDPWASLNAHLKYCAKLVRGETASARHSLMFNLGWHHSSPFYMAISFELVKALIRVKRHRPLRRDGGSH